MSVEEAKEFLKSKGYFVGNLWHIEDVKTNYPCSEEQAQEVLSKALQNEATIDQIWFAINSVAEDNGLERKEED